MPHWLHKEPVTPFTGPLRHQARLVYVILTLMAAYFAVIGTINVFVFASYTIAALDYAGMLGMLAVLYYFHYSRRLMHTSWLVVMLLIGVILVFIHMAEGRSYSLIWVTLLPPVTFFLLGRRAGAWVCGAVFVYVAIYVYINMPRWEPAEFTLGTFLNIVEVLAAHWLLFRLYERSRAEAFAELELLSETDKLTGLYNRSRLDSFLLHEIERHHRDNRPLTLILSDIDHFKRINDQHGHLSGDRALKVVADLLVNHTRSSDICGRWGGEEFLFICPDTSSAAASHIIGKIQQALSVAELPHRTAVTLSFGVASLGPDDTAEHVLRRADDALYQAKREGRNTVVTAADRT
ncbi:MAG: GGDEF domain-containing protein [Pseudohongiella sp.]|nr:GGDEF domain-containing protein [Pseudohongiella sp.]MDP2125838.1 GGDEF domain-containing protein [Pseudohongiella sp.]